MQNKILIQTDQDFEELKKISHSGFAKPLPIELSFEIAQNDCIIYTLEGTHNVPSNSVIMTGLEGEKYAMSMESFQNKYENIVFFDDSKIFGKANKKVKPDQEYLFLHPSVEFSAKMWNGIFEASEGDFLIRYGVNDFGIIKPFLFERLYLKI